jgi:GMP synthase-like glutamine amidotransferase
MTFSAPVFRVGHFIIIMKPLYIFRHIECEGPGFLGEVLSRFAIPGQLIAIDRNDAIPATVDGCSGLVFMGGPMSVNDPLPWIGQELDLIRQAHARGLPVLGHCLGGQLICKALGGTVSANPVREIGWHPVRKLSNDAAQSWLDGLPANMELFHWHGETFSVPEGAEILLESDFCARQAFASGNTLALQCHVEMTAPMVREWASLYRRELDDPSPAVQSGIAMTEHLEQRITALQGIAERLYRRWLKPLLG